MRETHYLNDAASWQGFLLHTLVFRRYYSCSDFLGEGYGLTWDLRVRIIKAPFLTI